MAIYAIGDVQGCFDDLLALLDAISFDPADDRLWFAGDLVNRGPRSLEVLRFVRDMGERAITVLGNHDIHLMAVAGGHTQVRRKDTFHDILNAPDRDELLHWLRHQPLLHHDENLGITMIHAGLPPQWDLATARACAAEVGAALRGADCHDYLAAIYGDTPGQWSPALGSWDRLRFITNCLTRMRYCDAQGRLALREKGPPGTQPPGYFPWFAVPHRASTNMEIVFGHWSTLGVCDTLGVHHIDTGCVWGGTLTALRLDRGSREKRERTGMPCGGECAPGEN